jgi:hypothetical protein
MISRKGARTNHVADDSNTHSGSRHDGGAAEMSRVRQVGDMRRRRRSVSGEEHRRGK